MWSFRRPGGNAMQLTSSDAAAVLFFLYKGKEKNGGAKKAGDQWSPLRFESEYDRIRRGAIPTRPRRVRRQMSIGKCNKTKKNF